MNVFELPLNRSPRSVTDLELFGLSGKFFVVEQLLLLVLEQFSDTILLSIRASNETFGGGRGDMYTYSFKPSPVFSLTTFGIQ